MRWSMPRTAHIFLVLITVASGCVRVNAQSASSPVSSKQGKDLFSGVHDALDRTLNGVLSETRDAADTAHGDRDLAAPEMHPSAPDAAESEVMVSRTGKPIEMRRCDGWSSCARCSIPSCVGKAFRRIWRWS